MNNRQRHDEQGQVLVMAIALTTAISVALFAAYNVARVSGARVRLMYAADNAAWSAATYQARMMNYMSYMNRAMIVNHVTAAQAVTAAGFMRYQATAADNLCTALCWVPYLGQFLRGMDQYINRADSLVMRSAPLLMQGVNVMNAALQVSQQAVWLLGEVEMPRVAQRVLTENEPHAKLLETPLVLATQRYADWTHRYSSEAERWRFGHTVEAARDGWTATRRNDGLQWLQSSVVQTPGVRNFRFARRGGTDLSNIDRWEAVDTLSLKYATPRWHHGWHWRDLEQLPLGWGSRTSGSGNVDRRAQSYGNSGTDNPRATSYAWSGQENLSARYRGIGTYIDLNQNRRTDTLPVVVEAYLDGHQVATANRTDAHLHAGPALRTQDPLVGDRISSSSRADTFFDRPAARQDGNNELASTFNPYWHARLVSLSRTQLLLNDLLSGRGPITLTPWVTDANNGER